MQKWADNIKMNLKEIGFDGMEWINLAYDKWLAHVDMVTEPLGSIKCNELLEHLRNY
jgi:hypothetical protein